MHDLKTASEQLGIPNITLRKACISGKIPCSQKQWGSRLVWELDPSDYPVILEILTKKTGVQKKWTCLELDFENAQKTGLLTGLPLSPATVERTRYGMKSFWTVLGMEPSLNHLALENVRLAIFSISPEKYSTRENIYKACLSFWKFLILKNIKPETDLERFKKFKPRRKQQPRRTQLTPEKFQELLTLNTSHTDGRSDYDIALTEIIAQVLYHTGIRRSELMHLKASDFDRMGKAIHLNKTKTGEPRSVGVSKDLYRAIVKYEKQKPKSLWLVCQASGKQLTTTVINHRIKNFGLRGNHEITPHGLRASFVTGLLSDGVPVNHVKKLIGHKHLNTTDLYDRTTTEQALDALRHRESLLKK
jgi:site-specific recombinase XerD